MAKPKSFKTRCGEILRFAEQEATTADNWVELHNRIFGVGAIAGRLFQNASERTQFAGTDEYKRIQELIAAAGGDIPNVKSADEVSGRFNLRLPKSVHAALLAEADDEGVSLNQLCVAKLSSQLRAVVQNH